MDRRQRKTREAIFAAFSALLARKDFTHITVGEILELADVGRATFYAHFETKDFLLKAFCDELFCHIFDTAERDIHRHDHIFKCGIEEPAIVHLLRHLKNNDNNILALLSSQNSGLFLPYFRSGLRKLLVGEERIGASSKRMDVPENYWNNHVVSVFVETVLWWIDNGLQQSPETIADYYMRVV